MAGGGDDKVKEEEEGVFGKEKGGGAGCSEEMVEKKVMVEEEQQKVHAGAMTYPPPLFPHAELVGNPLLFMDVLRSFHSAMGTRFMKPVIGGKELDLHLLYMEVTKRGGIEKVLGERRWREVINLFGFPSTATSASFVLRKYYLSLLHHFEQVYFFGAKGPLIPPSAALQTKSYLSKFDQHRSVSAEPVMEKSKAVKRPISESLGQVAQAAVPSYGGNSNVAMDFPSVLLLQEKKLEPDPFNFSVAGTIDAKFDLGYFVTVKMNNQILKGVLYHVVDPAAAPFYPAKPVNTIAAVVPAPEQAQRRRKKQRRRDPDHPKPNRSAYNFFFAEKHSQLKAQFPLREREFFSKTIGGAWNKLAEEERKVYQEISEKDKERYKSEMQEYRARLGRALPANAGAKDAASAEPSSTANGTRYAASAVPSSSIANGSRDAVKKSSEPSNANGGRDAASAEPANVNGATDAAITEPSNANGAMDAVSTKPSNTNASKAV